MTVNSFALIIAVLFFALWNSRSAYPLTTGNGYGIHIMWSDNVSSMYPPSDPLIVKLGDKLNITCPANGTSNVWIQKHLQQYEDCNCSIPKTMTTRECDPDDTTIRHVCQDEVLIQITHDSENLKSALSFQSDSTFYLISYSLGNKVIAGYGRHTSGGECTRGFKMAVRILPSASDRTINGTSTVTESSLPIKNTTLPDSRGLQSNGAKLNLTIGVSVSFMCFLSLIATVYFAI